MAIINHIAETKESQTRFACRFIPIDILCKAKLDDFKIFIQPILAKYFTLQNTQKEAQVEAHEQKYLTWCMEFKNKNNNNLKKNEVLDFIFN